MFRTAIVCPPCVRFHEGHTMAALGKPDYELALEQHRKYCSALEDCGLRVVRLEAEPRHPDSAFVEDTAVLTERGGMLARPGVSSRAGEVPSIREALSQFFSHLRSIQAPGTLDGGDICEAEGHFFIGISRRTNEQGAEQLAAWLAEMGYTSTLVDIRDATGILHLKSGVSYIGDNRLVVIESMANREPFRNYEQIPVGAGDEYAANCIRVNDHLLLAAGFPAVEFSLRKLGYSITLLEMSEFQKMDGGLSCLSLRF